MSRIDVVCGSRTATHGDGVRRGAGEHRAFARPGQGAIIVATVPVKSSVPKGVRAAELVGAVLVIVALGGGTRPASPTS